MSNFAHHEPCPRCNSRDNLGVWDDGHKYCFGCKYYIPSPETIESLKKKTADMEQHRAHADLNFDVSGFTYRLPDSPRVWLRKYGISDAEIEHYKIQWNEKTESLVFPVYNQDKRMLYCQERYFGPDKSVSKYITHGSKTQQLAFIQCAEFPKTIVLVEDFVSAIKVGRVCSAAPLLGATIDGIGIRWLLGRFLRVRVWLDLDKATTALQEASKVSQVIPDTRVILTPLDPKEYSTNEIIKHLKEVGIASSL